MHGSHRLHRLCRLHRHLIILSAALFIIILMTGCQNTGWQKASPKWYENNPVVAHALGTTGEEPYNSLEGFEYSLSKGHKVFECDFALTSDDELVLCHSFDESGQEGIDDDHIPTKEQFMNTPLEGKYTPLSLDDMLRLLKEHEDIYLVTDFKSDDSTESLRQAGIFTDAVKAIDKNLFDRIIIQFYQEEELAGFKKLGDFGGYIFTLYKTDFDGEVDKFTEYAAFCKENDVDVIVMKKGLWRKALAPIAKEYGIRVYPHTVYTRWQYERMIRTDADGAYCDNVSRDEVNTLKEVSNHWYDKYDGFSYAKDADEALSLYQNGEKAVYLDDVLYEPTAEAVGYVLAEDKDAYFAYPFDEDSCRIMAQKIYEIYGESDGNEILSRTVVFTKKRGIINHELSTYMFWCDVVFVYDEPGDLHDFKTALKDVQEKGFSTLMVDEDRYTEEYSQLAQKYDLHIYENSWHVQFGQ